MESFDPKFWLDLAQWVVSLLLLAWMYFSNRDRVTQAKMQELAKDLDDRLDDHEKRLTTVETEIKSMPSAREFREMEGDIKGIRAILSGIEKGMHVLGKQLDRVNDYLMQAKKS